jgi:hypothetical protein
VTTTNLWRVTAIGATAREASVTSRLDFYRQPAWMRQWPYAHTIEITDRLSDGVLEVATAVVNLSDDPTVAVGFHPYFQLTGSAASAAEREPSRRQPRRGVQRPGPRCRRPGDDVGGSADDSGGGHVAGELLGGAKRIRGGSVTGTSC